MDTGIGTFTELDFEEAAPACRDASTRRGFDILHESDLTATLLREARPPGSEESTPGRVLVLGVSKPGFAAAAYAVNKDVALFIPTNVVVREAGGGSVIHALNPTLLSQVVSGGLQDLADQLSSDFREIMRELTR